MEAAVVRFTLNDQHVEVQAHPMTRLLDVLREECGLTGTKEGCGEGECGACTVLLDGQAVNACLVPVAHVEGRRIVTIEGLKGRHPLQGAFVSEGGTQCGICTPGMILAAAALPPHPTLDQVKTGLAGNLCRCTGYMGIYRAIQKAQASAKKRRAGSGTPAPARTTAGRPATGRKAAARPAAGPARKASAGRTRRDDR